MGDGVVEVELYGYFPAGTVPFVGTSEPLVEVSEEKVPSAEYVDGLGDHAVGESLVIPAVLDPQAGLAIPCGDARCMNPRHLSGMCSDGSAQRLVGFEKELGALSHKNDCREQEY